MRKWQRHSLLLVLLAAGIPLAILPEFIRDVEPRTRFLVGAGIVLCFVLSFVAQRRLDRSESQEAHTPSVQLRQRLIDKVLAYAQSQFDGGLYRRARKEFHLAERPLDITTLEDDRPIPPGGIEQHYRDLDGPLVILGEPGAGKSTLLHELTTLLVPKDDGDSIPVPFELSAWTARQLPLEEFLTAELGRQYGVGESLAKRWVAAELIIPMLDGLDEVPTSHRAACVDRIKAFWRAHPRVKLVVACREAEYGELGLGVETYSAVVVHTLSRKAVEDYLAKEEFFDGLRKALAVAPELWELMTTPLMLWVAAYAFERGGAVDLGTAADVRAALLDRFVDRMLAREVVKRGDARPTFSVEDTRRWLGETAAFMGRVGVTSFHLEDLSIDWMPEAKRATANRQLRWGFRLVVGLVDGPNTVANKRSVDTVTWSWPDAKKELVRFLVVGLVAGLVVGLVGGLFDGLFLGLFLAVGSSLFVSLAGGLVTDSVSLRSAANGGLRQSGLYAARYFLFLLIPAFGFVLVARWLEAGTVIAFFTCAGGTTLVGAVIALNKGGGFCIQNLMLRYLLARGGHTPWRYTTFLHHAVERVIMIRQGGSFRFLHRMIQEHLAASDGSARSAVE